ncbi:MAG: hypothetical protein IKV35_01900 [Clostridia bacterium]|nr:hypothetical protein [Clostridia bacterium]
MQRIYQVGAVNNAMRAKRVLEKNGIRAYVRRETDGSGKLGCGYGVLVPSDAPNAATILMKHGITILGVKGRGDG